MQYLLLACQCALAVTLLLASAGKILDPVPFRDSLHLTFRAEWLALALAVIIPMVELGLVFGLFLSPPHLLAGVFGLITALLGLFTLWVGYIYRRGLRISCGCFGSGDASIGRRTIIRNMVFIVIGLLGCYLALQTRSILPSPSFLLFASVGALVLAFMLLRAFVLARPVLALSLADLPDQP